MLWNIDVNPEFHGPTPEYKSTPLRVWNESGQRCVAPPAPAVQSVYLKCKYGYMVDTTRRKREASYEMMIWKQENPGEVYDDDIVGPDKRWRANMLAEKKL